VTGEEGAVKPRPYPLTRESPPMAVASLAASRCMKVERIFQPN
jgi:hypothetical protein